MASPLPVLRLCLPLDVEGKVGLEPTTVRLTAGSSAIELLTHIKEIRLL